MPKPKKRKTPAAGAIYTRMYKGTRHTLKIVKRGTEVGYSVHGIVYETPSAAANSISKSKANGWTFWKIQG
jgi:hypothetical protein